MFLIDSHCHIDKLYNSINKKIIKIIINKMIKKKILHIINISTSINNFYKIRYLFHEFKKFISLTLGIHPLYIKKINYNKIINIINKNNNLIVGIGETGLDYKLKLINKKLQQKYLLIHLSIAKKIKKPIIIHCRYAYKDLIKILKNYDYLGIIHCFTGNLYEAKKLLDLGFYLSFSGIITFINNKKNELNSIIKYIPLNKILIETDSPYLSPIPYKNKMNNPINLIYIAKYISIIKKINIYLIMKYTVINTIKIFNLHKKIKNIYF